MIQKNDAILIFSVCLAAFLLFGYYSFTGKQGENAVVSVDGTVTATYSLAQDGIFPIRGTAGGMNTLVIRDGKACIQEADCPDKLCVRQGWIHRTGESVICLPHKVVVTIEGRGQLEVDVLAG